MEEILKQILRLSKNDRLKIASQILISLQEEEIVEEPKNPTREMDKFPEGGTYLDLGNSQDRGDLSPK